MTKEERIDVTVSSGKQRAPALRWYQFTVRSLLLAMLLVCIVLSLFGWRQARISQQEELIAHLRPHGPNVWWRLNGHITSMCFFRISEVSDEELAVLPRLYSLVSLNVDSSKVTDATLAYVKQVPTLTDLTFYHTEITDEGLKELLDLRNLERLCLYSNSQITHNGIQELAKSLPDCSISYVLAQKNATESNEDGGQYGTIRGRNGRFRGK